MDAMVGARQEAEERVLDEDVRVVRTSELMALLLKHNQIAAQLPRGLIRQVENLAIEQLVTTGQVLRELVEEGLAHRAGAFR